MSKLFCMQIEGGNAAFDDDAKLEVARILRVVADRLENGHDFGFCMDYNGNRVGKWVFNQEEESEDCE